MSALSWAVYAVLVSLLLAGAAWAAEAGARAQRWPVRWGWAAALLGSVLLPVLASLRPERAEATSPLLMPVVTLPALVLDAPAPAFDLAALLVWGWLAASGVVLLALLAAHVQLWRARRGWREVELDGARLWLSHSTGPAVFGALRPRIVVPEWLLTVDAEARRLMLLHEEEHRVAGDSRLLLGGLFACAAMPWNPLLWWQLRRLRAAVELDCDARVLARSAEPVRYGELLLEIGRRRTTRLLPLAAFAEPQSLLERRLRTLLQWPPRRRPGAAVLGALAALALFGWACAARDPLAGNGAQRVDRAAAAADSPTGTASPSAVPPTAAVTDTPPPTPRAGPEAPGFTPMTDRPELKNPARVRELLTSGYPPALRDAGIGGSVAVWFYIDEQGRPVRTLLSKTSGYPAFDEAALLVAAAMEFTPAKHRGAVVPVWVEIPIVFSAGEKRTETTAPARPAGTDSAGAAAPSRRDLDAVRAVRASADSLASRAARRPSAESLAAGFTPMTVRPELKNSARVQQALVEKYPPLLRDAGVGGQAWVWFFIDETGRVTKSQLSRTSGHPELDAAALAIAEIMEFTPAENRGKVVSVWLEIPIMFAAK